jgi:hypothetical protein
MKRASLLSILLVIQTTVVAGFAVPKRQHGLKFASRGDLTSCRSPSTLLQIVSTATTGDTPEVALTAKTGKKTLQELRAEGGPLTFNTPIGALNPFAIYYGLMSIFLGIPWYFALKGCQFMYLITGGRFDKKVRL